MSVYFNYNVLLSAYTCKYRQVPKSILITVMFNCVATYKYLPCSYSSFLGKTAPSFLYIYIYACNLKFVRRSPSPKSFFLLQYLRGKKTQNKTNASSMKRGTVQSFIRYAKMSNCYMNFFFLLKSSNSNAF